MFRLNRKFVWFAALCLVLGTLACGPEEDTGSGTPGDGDGGSGDQSQQEEDDWNPQFIEIAEITHATCAIPACHGEPSGNTPLEFGGNGDAVSLSTIQGIFESHTSENGRDLVVPGDAESSDLYQVLVSDDPDEFMPQGLDPLSDAQIALVRGWIDDGANYD